MPDRALGPRLAPELDGIDRSEKYPAEYLAVARKPAG